MSSLQADFEGYKVVGGVLTLPEAKKTQKQIQAKIQDKRGLLISIAITAVASTIFAILATINLAVAFGVIAWGWAVLCIWQLNDLRSLQKLYDQNELSIKELQRPNRYFNFLTQS